MGSLGNFMRQDARINELKRLEQRLRPAKIRGEKKCVRCGFCCHMRPCAPLPDEVEPIAKLLKLSVEEAIKKYFLVDRFNGSEIHFLRVIGKEQEDLGGKFLPSSRSFDEGHCIFLEEIKEKGIHRCKIYKAIPAQGATNKCWEKQSDEEARNERKEFLKAWAGQLKKKFRINGEALENADGDDYYNGGWND